MKVILTAQVSNLGQIGQVVEVKNGYAKNFLIPNQKAICFTPNSQKLFEAKKAEFEKANEENLSLANKVKNKLLGQNIVIIENASDDGRLYGSVNPSLIAEKVNKIVGERTVAKSNVFLGKPIKELGVYLIKIDLHSEAVFEVKLIVSRLESEVEVLLKAYDKAKKDALEAEKKPEAKVKKSEEAVEQTEEVVASEADVKEEKAAKKKKVSKKKED